MEAIVLAFTLKGQDSNEIVKQIDKIGTTHRQYIVIHGFMPRKEVEKQGWSTAIVDALERNFPVPLNMYADGKPLREEMAEIAGKLRAVVLVIGEEKEGVAEEVALYKALSLTVYNYPLPNAGEKATPTPL